MDDLDALKAFLCARYDEEQALAEGGDPLSPDLTLRLDGDLRWISMTPARVLAEVEAKRKILDAWPDPFGTWTADQADAVRAMKGQVLKLMARPYAYHADFQPGWAPPWVNSGG